VPKTEVPEHGWFSVRIDPADVAFAVRESK